MLTAAAKRIGRENEGGGLLEEPVYRGKTKMHITELRKAIRDKARLFSVSPWFFGEFASSGFRSAKATTYSYVVLAHFGQVV
jgi:hypothetical protein